MCYQASVCLSVCLFICLSACNFTWKLLIGFSWKFYQRCITVDEEESSEVRSHSPVDPDLGMFLKDSSTLRVKWGIFLPFDSHLLKNWWSIHENFIIMYLWTRKSSLNFECHPDPNPSPDTDSRLQIQTGFVLAALSDYSRLSHLFFLETQAVKSSDDWMLLSVSISPGRNSSLRRHVEMSHESQTAYDDERRRTPAYCQRPDVADRRSASYCRALSIHVVSFWWNVLFTFAIWKKLVQT